MKKAVTMLSLLAIFLSFTAAYAVNKEKNSTRAYSMPDLALKGKDVVTNQGEILGKISNVILDPQTNQVSFVMISGDTLGVGD